MRAMVLSDGTTYTGVAGCKIVQVEECPARDADEAIAAVAAGDPEEGGIVVEFTGGESVALTEDELDAVREALLCLDEWGGRWKDWQGVMVPKRKRERVRDSLAAKLGV